MDAISARVLPTASVPEWASAAVAQIRSIVGDETFPCIFARRAFSHDAWCFAFVESLDRDEDRLQVANALRHYLKEIDPDPDEPKLVPLLIVVRPQHPHLTLAEYHRRGWELLQSLHERDVDEWPKHIPTDPDDNQWGFCFAGQPLFVNFSAPAHAYFRSRNLGDSFVFVIQRATNFDAVTSYDWDGPKGRAVRRVIRTRVESYEGHGVPAEFAIAGTAEERAWKQMAIPEPDGAYPPACPFHRKR